MKWYEVKKIIDELPENSSMVLRSHNINNNEVEGKNAGKYTRFEVDMKPIDNHTVKLIIYKNLDQSVKKASYVVFNERENTVYERVIS